MDWVAKQAVSPDLDWDEGGRVHNWRNHVGSRTKAIWNTLSDEAKVAIALDADDSASNEEWD